MSELKPCPCGADAELRQDGDTEPCWVCCTKCTMNSGEYPDIETAIFVWNTRPDLKAELVDEFNLRISKAEPYLKDQNVLHKADIRQIFREAINTIMGDTE